jgi:hypothetical protein
MENNRVNLSNANLERQNRSSCSKSSHSMVQQVAKPKNIANDRHNKNTEILAQQKSQIMQVDKQRLADIILKQNSIIMQQSSQMMDLVKLVNDVDNSQNLQDENENVPTNGSLNSSDLQRNINILKNRNDICKEASELRQRSVKLFESSVRIQFVLFSLFILVLFWLVYHYMSPDFE